MTDQLLVQHRHDEGDQHVMQHVDDERIDGLKLREYTCTCGFTAAVLTRVPEEQPGHSWPFRFRSAAPRVS
jgi:hypothetical protein